MYIYIYIYTHQLTCIICIIVRAKDSQYATSPCASCVGFRGLSLAVADFVFTFMFSFGSGSF